jgi:tripartite-type tricarboxylate transporter receptor subunit TctC
MSPCTPLSRRALLRAATAAALVPSPLLLRAQDSSRPIKIIVPLPAGGAADVSARILAETMQAQMGGGATVIVDNRPGGLYQIGMQALTSAPADGHTLIHLNPTMCAVQATHGKYDLRPLAMIGLMGSTDCILLASNSAPFKTAKEMVEWARANPGKLSYGSIGQGGIEHMIMLLIAKQGGFDAQMVPFKGGPDGALAVAQGEVMVMPLNPVVYLMFKDKLRALGAVRTTRGQSMPELPTLKEQGIDVPEVNLWGGLAAPAGTPAAVIARLEKALAGAVQGPALKKRYEPIGLYPRFASGQEFAQLVSADLNWMNDVARTANLKMSS